MRVNFKAMQQDLRQMLDSIDEIVKEQSIEISEGRDDGCGGEIAGKLNDIDIEQILRLDEDIKDDLLREFVENYFLMCSFTHLIVESND